MLPEEQPSSTLSELDAAMAALKAGNTEEAMAAISRAKFNAEIDRLAMQGINKPVKEQKMGEAEKIVVPPLDGGEPLGADYIHVLGDVWLDEKGNEVEGWSVMISGHSSTRLGGQVMEHFIDKNEAIAFAKKYADEWGYILKVRPEGPSDYDVMMADWKKGKSAQESRIDEDEDEVVDANDDGPQEEDIVVSDAGRLGSEYSVGVVDGKRIGRFKSREDVNAAIKAYMKKHNFFPNVWYIDDHGGRHPWGDVGESKMNESADLDAAYEDGYNDLLQAAKELIVSRLGMSRKEAADEAYAKVVQDMEADMDRSAGPDAEKGLFRYAAGAEAAKHDFERGKVESWLGEAEDLDSIDIGSSPSDDVDRVGVKELVLFIDNDADLYRQQATAIQKNLMRKKAAGVYDSEKAINLWMYLVDAGAQKYVKEFGSGDMPWHVMFPKATRLEAARMLAGQFEEEAELGNYDSLIPKKYRKLEGETKAKPDEDDDPKCEKCGGPVDSTKGYVNELCRKCRAELRRAKAAEGETKAEPVAEALDSPLYRLARWAIDKGKDIVHNRLVDMKAIKPQEQGDSDTRDQLVRNMVVGLQKNPEAKKQLEAEMLASAKTSPPEKKVEPPPLPEKKPRTMRKKEKGWMYQGAMENKASEDEVVTERRPAWMSQKEEAVETGRLKNTVEARPKMTPQIAHAVATDAGNASMKAGGRTKWNQEDSDAFAAEYERVYPEEQEKAGLEKKEEAKTDKAVDPIEASLEILQKTDSIGPEEAEAIKRVLGDQ